MQRGLHKKLTYEDKFDRKYRCNPQRFVGKMKRENRQAFRRKLKRELEKEIK